MIQRSEVGVSKQAVGDITFVKATVHLETSTAVVSREITGSRIGDQVLQDVEDQAVRRLHHRIYGDLEQRLHEAQFELTKLVLSADTLPPEERADRVRTLMESLREPISWK